jgi:hypothetical protein
VGTGVFLFGVDFMELFKPAQPGIIGLEQMLPFENAFRYDVFSWCLIIVIILSG